MLSARHKHTHIHTHVHTHTPRLCNHYQDNLLGPVFFFFFPLQRMNIDTSRLLSRLEILHSAYLIPDPILHYTIHPSIHPSIHASTSHSIPMVTQHRLTNPNTSWKSFYFYQPSASMFGMNPNYITLGFGHF